AVAAQGMRDEAVVSGVAHRRIEEAVDEEGARGLVDLVFDRLAAKRHLDDDVEVVGRIAADRDGVDVHVRLICRRMTALWPRSRHDGKLCWAKRSGDSDATRAGIRTGPA